ncbi:hypothetical protein GCM10020000_84840 [Streptomyces olivoverticillatus]
MAVAVDQGDLVARDAEVSDHAVGGGIAVQDEIGAFGSEDAGRVAFGVADGPGVLEERAEFLDGNRQVAAQQALAEIVEESAADRGFQEGDASGVGGGCARSIRGRRRSGAAP